MNVFMCKEVLPTYDVCMYIVSNYFEIFPCCSGSDGVDFGADCVQKCIEDVVDMRDFGGAILQLCEIGMYGAFVCMYVWTYVYEGLFINTLYYGLYVVPKKLHIHTSIVTYIQT